MNKKKLFSNNINNNNKINNLMVKRYNTIWNSIIKIYKEVKFIYKIKNKKTDKTTYCILLFFFVELIKLN
jgi:hypothetical protein